MHSNITLSFFVAGATTLLGACVDADGASVASAGLAPDERTGLLATEKIAADVAHATVFMPHANMMLVENNEAYQLAFRQTTVPAGSSLESELLPTLPRLRAGDFAEVSKVFSYPVSYTLPIDAAAAARFRDLLASPGSTEISISWDMDKTIHRRRGTTVPTHGGGPGGQAFDYCSEDLAIRFKIALSSDDLPELAEAPIPSNYTSTAQQVTTRQTIDIETCLNEWAPVPAQPE